MYLVAMNENVLPGRERPLDPRAGIIEMRPEVRGGDVHDVDPCDGHVWVIERRKPRDVDDLDDVGDAVFLEEIIVCDGGERTEPEVTELLSGRREKDLVHWGANGLNDFRWNAVEPNHLFPRILLGCTFSRLLVLPVPLPPSLPPSL